MFQVFNIPVPKSLDEQNFLANYKTEKAHFVALSEDSLKFIVIDDADFHLYLRQRLPFCPIRRPIVNVMTSSMCIPALLPNDTDQVSRFCDKVIHVNRTVDPTAEYLGNGHWIVISAEPLDLDVRCKSVTSANSSRVVRAVFPLSLVKLDFGCSAFSTHFQLPTHFRTDSHLEPYQVYYMNRTIASNDVWNHVANDLSEHKVSFGEAMKILPPAQTRTVALSVLKEQISMLKSQSHYHFQTVTVPAVSVTSVLLVVGFVLLVIKCVRRPSVSLSFLSKVSSRPKNPFPNRPTADDLATNCAAYSPSTPLEQPESGQVAPLATIAPTALSWLSHDPTDKPTRHHATQRT